MGTRARMRPVLVVGGGIAGMTAAVETAEVGHDVLLVEQGPSLGGRVLQMHRYFPKMCPPACGFELNARRVRQSSRISVLTLASVIELERRNPYFEARIRVRPRHVTGAAPLDDALAEQLQGERPDEENAGIGTTKALYWPHDLAVPPLPVIDRKTLTVADEALLREQAGAIDLDAEARVLRRDVGAVIVATGWRPYDATRLTHLGYGRFPNVVTNVELERLAARRGPTKGAIERPSDGRPAENVAFVQCAGSRDENHLAYCSAVCCMASLKHVRYLRERNPEARATVFYIDLRTIGRLERFLLDTLEDPLVTPVKGKVARVAEDAPSGDLRLDVEDTVAGATRHPRFDLVVLATGMVPNGAGFATPRDTYGFVAPGADGDGVFAAGCARRPCDVSRATKDATAAAMRAIRYVRRQEE